MSHTRRLVRLRERRVGMDPRWVVGVVLLIGLVVEAVHQLSSGDHPEDLPIIDDWLHAGLILASSAICAWGARRRRAGSPSRAAWWCYAAALLLFAIAEITWSALYSGGGDVPAPNPTDPLYLSTYPLFMAGLVLMVQARVLDVPWHRWLDGFVLVLIVATPGVLLLIEPVLAKAPIDPLGQMVTVAYPLGDILLLGALLGSLPLMSWRLGGSWPWVGLGLVCMTVADAAYSLTAADVVAHDGPYDFLWSAGSLAFAVGATRLPSQARPSREITGWPAIALPLGAQLFAVATQVYGYFQSLPAAERLLTIAVLVIGVAQIIVSRPRPDPEPDATEPRPSDQEVSAMRYTTTADGATAGDTLRLLCPQWQGAGTSSVRALASEFPFDVARRGYAVGSAVLEAILPPHRDGPTATAPVTLGDEGQKLVGGVEARAVIIDQLARALEVIARHAPARIATLGGECAVSVAPFSAMAHRYGDDLAVLWIDSHPDIGTPASHYPGFHAMAVAALTGHGDPDIIKLLPATVRPDRVALVGLHEWTDDDFPNVAEWGIQTFGPDQLRTSTQPLLGWLAATGCRRVAIHFDVDTIDSNEIVLGLGAVPDGLTSGQARRIVADVTAAADVVALTIAEFFPRQVMALQQILVEFPLIAPRAR